MASRYKPELERWGVVGGTRRVWVRGDRNKTAHVEVKVDAHPLDCNYYWTLMTDPLGEEIESGCNLFKDDAKRNATRALNRYLSSGS